MRFQFVSWWAFLVLYFVARLLLALYMACFGFSAPEGIPFTVSRISITLRDVASFATGVPIEDENGVVVLVPERDCLHLLEIASDGSLILEGEPITSSELLLKIPKLHDALSGSDEHVVVLAAPDVSYQRFVNVLDSVVSYNRTEPSFTVNLLTISPE